MAVGLLLAGVRRRVAQPPKLASSPPVLLAEPVDLARVMAAVPGVVTSASARMTSLPVSGWLNPRRQSAGVIARIVCTQQA